MKLEVTEEEAREIISDRWIASHKKIVYFPAGVGVVCFLGCGIILGGVLDLNDWISIPSSILVAMPGLFYYLRALRKSGKEAILEIQALKDKLP